MPAMASQIFARQSRKKSRVAIGSLSLVECLIFVAADAQCAGVCGLRQCIAFNQSHLALVV
jgi:hypothetical protein